MATVYTEVEVDVDLSDFDDWEIIDEIKDRGLEGEFTPYGNDEKVTELLNSIWLKKRMSVDYAKDVEELLYETLGKIV